MLRSTGSDAKSNNKWSQKVESSTVTSSSSLPTQQLIRSTIASGQTPPATKAPFDDAAKWTTSRDESIGSMQLPATVASGNFQQPGESLPVTTPSADIIRRRPSSVDITGRESSTSGKLIGMNQISVESTGGSLDSRQQTGSNVTVENPTTTTMMMTTSTKQTKVKQFDGQLDESMTMTLTHGDFPSTNQVNNNNGDQPESQFSIQFPEAVEQQQNQYKRNLNASLEAQAKLRDTVNQLHFNKTLSLAASGNSDGENNHLLVLDKFESSSKDSGKRKNKNNGNNNTTAVRFTDETTSLLPMTSDETRGQLATTVGGDDGRHSSNHQLISPTDHDSGKGFVPILLNEVAASGDSSHNRITSSPSSSSGDISVSATRAPNSVVEYLNQRPIGADLLEAADEIHQKRSHNRNRDSTDVQSAAWGRRKSGSSRQQHADRHQPSTTGSPARMVYSESMDGINGTSSYEDIVTWTPAAGPAAYRAGSGFQPAKTSDNSESADDTGKELNSIESRPGGQDSTDGSQQESDFHSTSGLRPVVSSTASNTNADESTSSSLSTTKIMSQKSGDFFGPAAEYISDSTKRPQQRYSANNHRLEASNSNKRGRQSKRPTSTTSTTTTTEATINYHDEERPEEGDNIDSGDKHDQVDNDSSGNQENRDSGDSEEFKPATPPPVAVIPKSKSARNIATSSKKYNKDQDEDNTDNFSTKANRVYEQSAKQDFQTKLKSKGSSSSNSEQRVKTGWRADRLKQQQQQKPQRNRGHSNNHVKYTDSETQIEDGHLNQSHSGIQWSQADTSKLAAASEQRPQESEVVAPKSQYQSDSANDISQYGPPIIKTFRIAPDSLTPTETEERQPPVNAPQTMSGFSPQPSLPIQTSQNRFNQQHKFHDYQHQHHSQGQSLAMFPRIPTQKQLNQQPQHQFQQQQQDGRFNMRMESAPHHYVARVSSAQPMDQFQRVNQFGRHNDYRQQVTPNSTWSITTFPYPQPTSDGVDYFSLYQQQQQQHNQLNGNLRQYNASPMRNQFAPHSDYQSFRADSASDMRATAIGNILNSPSIYGSSMSSGARLPATEPLTAPPPTTNVYNMPSPQLSQQSLNSQQPQLLSLTSPHSQPIIHQQQNSQQPSVHVPPPVSSLTSNKQQLQHQTVQRGVRNAPTSSQILSTSSTSGNGGGDSPTGSDMLTINVKTHAAVRPNQFFWDAPTREAIEHQENQQHQHQNGPTGNGNSNGQHVVDVIGKVPLTNAHLPPQHREAGQQSATLMSRRPLSAMRMVNAFGGDPTLAFNPASGGGTTNGHAYAGRATPLASVVPPADHPFGSQNNGAWAELAQAMASASNPHEVAFVEPGFGFGPFASPYGTTGALDNDAFSAAAANFMGMGTAAAMPMSTFESPPQTLSPMTQQANFNAQSNNNQKVVESKQFVKKGISAALPLATPVSVSDPFGWPMGYGSEAAKTLIKVNHVAPPPSYLIPDSKLNELNNVNKQVAAGQVQGDMLLPMASSVTGTWSRPRNHLSLGNWRPTTQPSVPLSAAPKDHMVTSTSGNTNYVSLTISTRPPAPKRSSLWQRAQKLLRLNRAVVSSTGASGLNSPTPESRHLTKRSIVEQVSKLVKRPARFLMGAGKKDNETSLAQSESQLRPQVVAPSPTPTTQLAIMSYGGTKSAFIPLVDNQNLLESDLLTKALQFSQHQHQQQQMSQQTASGMYGSHSMQVASYAPLNGNSNNQASVESIQQQQSPKLAPNFNQYQDPSGDSQMGQAFGQSMATSQLDHESELNFLQELDAQSSNVLEPPANEPGVLNKQLQQHQSSLPGARQRIKKLSEDLLKSSRKPLSKLRKMTSFSRSNASLLPSAQSTNISALLSPQFPTTMTTSSPTTATYMQASGSQQQPVSVAQKLNNIVSPSIMMSPPGISSLDNFNRFANPIRSWYQQQQIQGGAGNRPIDWPTTSQNQQHLLPLISHLSQQMSPYSFVTDPNFAASNQRYPQIQFPMTRSQIPGTPMQIQQHQQDRQMMMPPTKQMQQVAANINQLRAMNFNQLTAQHQLANSGQFYNNLPPFRPPMFVANNRQDNWKSLARALIDLQLYDHSTSTSGLFGGGAGGGESNNNNLDNLTGDSFNYSRPLVNLRRTTSDTHTIEWPHQRLSPRSNGSGSLFQRRPTTLRAFNASPSMTQPQIQSQHQLQLLEQKQQQVSVPKQQVQLTQHPHQQTPSMPKGYPEQIGSLTSVPIDSRQHMLYGAPQPPNRLQQLHRDYATTSNQVQRQAASSNYNQFAQNDGPQMMIQYQQQQQQHLQQQDPRGVYKSNTTNLDHQLASDGGSSISYTDAEMFTSPSKTVETLMSHSGDATATSGTGSGETVLTSEQASKLMAGQDEVTNLNALLASSGSSDEFASASAAAAAASSQHKRQQPSPSSSGDFTSEQQQQFQQQLLNQQQQNLFIPPSSNLFGSNYLPRPRLPKLIPSINSMASKFRQHLYSTFKLANPLSGSKWPNVLGSQGSQRPSSYMLSPGAKFHPSSFMLPTTFQPQPAEQTISSSSYYGNLQQQQQPTQQKQVAHFDQQFQLNNNLAANQQQQVPRQQVNNQQQFSRSVNPIMQQVGKVIHQAPQIQGGPSQVQLFPQQQYQPSGLRQPKLKQAGFSDGNGATFHHLNGSVIETGANEIPTSLGGDIYDPENSESVYLDHNSTEPIGGSNLLNSNSSILGSPNDLFNINQLPMDAATTNETGIIETNSTFEGPSEDLPLSVSSQQQQQQQQQSEHQNQMHNVMADVSGNLVTSDGTYITEEQPQVAHQPTSIQHKRPFNLPARVRLNLNQINNGTRLMVKPNATQSVDYHEIVDTPVQPSRDEPEADENNAPQIIHEYHSRPQTNFEHQQEHHQVVVADDHPGQQPQPQQQQQNGGGDSSSNEEHYELERVVPGAKQQTRPQSTQVVATGVHYVQQQPTFSNKYRVTSNQSRGKQAHDDDFREQQPSSINADYQVIKAQPDVRQELIVPLSNGTTIKRPPGNSQNYLVTSNSDTIPIEIIEPAVTDHQQQPASEDQNQQQIPSHQVYEPHEGPLERQLSGNESVEIEQQQQQMVDQNQQPMVQHTLSQHKHPRVYKSRVIQNQHHHHRPVGIEEVNSLEYDFKPINHGNLSSPEIRESQQPHHSSVQVIGNENPSSVREQVVTGGISTQYSSPLRPMVVEGNFSAQYASHKNQQPQNQDQSVLVDQPVIVTGSRELPVESTLSSQPSAETVKQVNDTNNSEQPVVFVSLKPERVIQQVGIAGSQPQLQQHRRRPLKMPKRAQMRANGNDWSSSTSQVSSPTKSPTSANQTTGGESPLIHNGNSASGSSMSVATASVSTTTTTTSSPRRVNSMVMVAQQVKPTGTPSNNSSSIASLIRDSFTRPPKSKIRWQGMGNGGSSNRTKNGVSTDGLNSSETSRSEQAWIVGGMTHQAYANGNGSGQAVKQYNLPEEPAPGTKIHSKQSSSYHKHNQNHNYNHQHQYSSPKHRPLVPEPSSGRGTGSLSSTTTTSTTTTTTSTSTTTAPPSVSFTTTTYPIVTDSHINNPTDRQEAESMDSAVVELVPVSDGTSTAELAARLFPNHNLNHQLQSNHRNHKPEVAEDQNKQDQLEALTTKRQSNNNMAPANHRPFSADPPIDQDSNQHNNHRPAKTTESRTAPTSFRLSVTSSAGSPQDSQTSSSASVPSTAQSMPSATTSSAISQGSAVSNLETSPPVTPTQSSLTVSGTSFTVRSHSSLSSNDQLSAVVSLSPTSSSSSSSGAPSDVSIAADAIEKRTDISSDSGSLLPTPLPLPQPSPPTTNLESEDDESGDSLLQRVRKLSLSSPSTSGEIMSLRSSNSDQESATAISLLSSAAGHLLPDPMATNSLPSNNELNADRHSKD